MARSVVLCFEDRSLSFYTFSFGHCVVCPCAIYGFLLPFQTFRMCLQLTNDACKQERVRDSHSLHLSEELERVLFSTDLFKI